ncbi:MAG: HAMP domain-containing sensor histidine kinase, partial [Bacteroidota bacterium]
MISSIKKHHWIIIAATLTVVVLGGMQMNWIFSINQFQERALHRDLKSVAPMITLHLELDSLFSAAKIISREDSIPISFVEHTIDSMIRDKGILQTYYYAIFQETSNGIYHSNHEGYESALRNSTYKYCLSCITTIQVDDDDLELDDKKKSDFTFLREVKGTKNAKEQLAREEYLWLSLHIPHRSFFTHKELWGLFALTIGLVGVLIGLFSYTIWAWSRQKKMSQVKDDFFNNMTHEFKTPLSSIRLATRVLQQNPNGNKKSIYLDLIENESKRLEGQVDKILQLSSIESHQMALEKESIGIHPLIEEAIRRLKLVVEQKNANVNVLLKLRDDTILGDKNHLSNCIYNLVENALKYAGKSPQILVTTFEKNGIKSISIKDNGVGIPKEFHKEIFDRFFRAQKNDRYR